MALNTSCFECALFLVRDFQSLQKGWIKRKVTRRQIETALLKGVSCLIV